MQFYYFWKKLSVHYKSTHLNSELNATDGNLTAITNQQEARPHVCEMPDCSAVSIKIKTNKRCYFYFFFCIFVEITQHITTFAVSLRKIHIFSLSRSHYCEFRLKSTYEANFQNPFNFFHNNNFDFHELHLIFN